MTSLLTECILPVSKPLISESTMDNGQKFYYLKGLFIEGETQNQNNRIYPKTEIEKAVNILNEKIQKTGMILGELDHPEGININMDRVAVAISQMELRGNNGYGTMKVIPAGLGLIVEGCIKVGVNLGVSSRGTGKVDRNGYVTDYDIITIDVVANPSARNAYPEATLAESIYGSPYKNEFMDIATYIHKNEKAQQYIINDFKSILQSFKK